ncbi:MAG: hypothetical protein IBJ11_00505 [Phycisphaerales bacterium]|nr:hypothetical protein [Phycisphaerales bacterium]
MGASLALALLVWWTYASNISGPAGELRAERERLIGEITSLQGETRKAQPAVQRLKTAAARTLGNSAETVVHRVRLALTAAGTAARLSSVASDSRAQAAVRNPAESVRVWGRDARAAPDFTVVTGSMRGEGTLEQALTALCLIQSQPWIKRISSVSLRPRDGGQRVELRVSLSTVFLEDLSPSEAPAPSPAEPKLLDQVRMLVARNMFAPPAAPPPPAQVPKPEPPSGPAYGDWVVTGLAEGAAGPELWVRNVKDNRTQSLAPGEKLLGAVFEGLSPDRESAILRIDADRFLISVGDPASRRDRKHVPK